MAIYRLKLDSIACGEGNARDEHTSHFRKFPNCLNCIELPRIVLNCPKISELSYIALYSWGVGPAMCLLSIVWKLPGSCLELSQIAINSPKLPLLS